MRRDCDNCKHGEVWAYAEPCLSCIEGSEWEESKHTNADRIKSKTDEELAEWLARLPCCPPGADVNELCFPKESCGTDMALRGECWLTWLRQEAEGADK